MVGANDETLVYNGEIYNFRELSSARRLHTLSDTQLLLDVAVRGGLGGAC